MTPGGKRVVLVAAVATNGVIGDGPDIPWQIPGEQARFKALTMGHVLLMGRATFESIGRALPGRSTVVLTRSVDWLHPDVLVAESVDAALELADDLPGDVMVAGGGAVYAALLPHADEQVLSEVRLTPDGDVFYPAFDRSTWVETSREPCDGYDVVRWARRAAGSVEPGFGPLSEHVEAPAQNLLGRTLITRLADPAVLLPVEDPVVQSVADDVARLLEPFLFTQMLTALALSAAKHARLLAATAGARAPTFADMRDAMLAEPGVDLDVVADCFDAVQAMAGMPATAEELVESHWRLDGLGLTAWLTMAGVYLAYARAALAWSTFETLDALLSDWFLLEQRALDDLV